MAENVIEFSDQSFDSGVLESDVPVLVDFWAVWCGPCKAIAPIVEEIANDYDGKVKVGKIDVDNNESISLLKKTLFGEKLSYTIEGNNYNIEGNSNGQLIGGNLTLLHCLLGSESSIDTNGKILFIEDLGEYLYHIDRMLISLKRAGYFDNCKGLIVGDFTDMRKNTTPFGRNLKELILDIVREYDFPVSFGFPAGHGEKNYPMILGREINLEVSKQQSTINFSN